MREMQILWEVAELVESYVTQFIIRGSAIKLIISITQDESLSEDLQKILGMILKMRELFWSEVYCYSLDFLGIAYYSITNHI